MIGKATMQLRKIELEVIGGEELRKRVSHAKNADKYIVFIQKVDHDVMPQLSGSNYDLDVSWKPKSSSATK